MAPLNEAPTGLRTRRWTFTFVGYYQGFRPVIPVRKADNSRVTHPSAALLPGPKARGHARLACIKRAASVRPERVSYSPVWNGSDFYAESLVASNQTSGPEPPKSGVNHKRLSHTNARNPSPYFQRSTRLVSVLLPRPASINLTQNSYAVKSPVLFSRRVRECQHRHPHPPLHISPSPVRRVIPPATNYHISIPPRCRKTKDATFFASTG